MKVFSKLWQRWQRFWKHIAKFLFRVDLLRGALAVAVMVSESIVAGVLFIRQTWATNKRTKAMEDAAKELARATANIEAGQRQKRLKNAIEHLGHKKDSVRMGGAYELFLLAKDTGYLRQTVLDFLCSHIRQTTGEDKYKEKYKTKLSEEIQSLLSLLFREEHDVFEDCSIKLQDSYLNGANLSQARLKKANLSQTQLQGADLEETQLQRAFLWEAQMQGAVLWQAQLQGVSSQEADFLPSAGFESSIRNRIDKPSGLTGIIFAGDCKKKTWILYARVYLMIRLRCCEKH